MTKNPPPYRPVGFTLDTNAEFADNLQTLLQEQILQSRLGVVVVISELYLILIRFPLGTLNAKNSSFRKAVPRRVIARRFPPRPDISWP
jgi:hypothetical protein